MKNVIANLVNGRNDIAILMLIIAACLGCFATAPAFAAPVMLDHQYFHISANPISYTMPAGNNRMLVVCASVRTNSYSTANVAQISGTTVDGVAINSGAQTYRGGSANVTRMGAGEFYQHRGDSSSPSTLSVAITGPNLHWPIAVDIFTFGNVDSVAAASGSGANGDTGATTSTNAVSTPGADYLVVTTALHFSWTATSVLNPVPAQNYVQLFGNRETNQYKTTASGYLVMDASSSVNYQFTNSSGSSDKWASVGTSYKSKYNVTATAGTGGSLVGWSDANYDYAATATMTAQAQPGYRFLQWEANVAALGAADSWAQVSTSATYSFNAGFKNDNQSLTLNRNGHALRAVFTTIVPTINTWPTASAITYGNPLSASVLSGGSATPTGTFSFTDPGTIPSSIGSYSASVTFMPDDTTNWVAVSGSVYVDVDLCPITVTADAKVKVYGNGDPALTYQITSGALVNGDSMIGVLSRDPGVDVGLYAITRGTLDAGTNYAMTYAGANLEIATRAITVTADAKTKVYGSGDPVLTYQITSGSLASGDSIGGALLRDAGETVGPYVINQGTLDAGTNYALTYVGADFEITKIPATVTLGALSHIYNGSQQSATSSTIPSGLVVEFTYDGSTTAPTNAGTYSVTATITDPIYQGSATDTLEIGKADQTITFDSLTAKTYGDASFDLTGDSTSGLALTYASSDTDVATINSTTVTIVAAGSTTITATQPGNTNYNAAPEVQQALIVNPATLTAAIVNNPTKYFSGNTAATLTPDNFSISGLVGTESISVTQTVGAYNTAAVGSKTVNAALNAGHFVAGAGTVLANYILPTVATGPGTITDKQIPNITAWPTASAITYGQALSASTLTGGTASVTGTFAFAAPTTVPNAGTYSASVTFTPGNTTAYASVSDNVDVIVNKALATLTLASLSHVYDGAPKAATATTNPADLTVIFTYDGATTAPTDAGEYDVTATISDTNYEGSASGVLIISLPTYVVNGKVMLDGSPLTGVTLSGLPGNPVTNSMGIYSATVDEGFAGTALPKRAGYTFEPVSRTYENVISNQTGQDYTATPIPPMNVTLTPSSTTPNEGATVVFTAMVTGGGGALHYEWKKDGVAIPESSDANQFSIASMTADYEGIYSVDVSDDENTVTSNLVLLQLGASLPVAGIIGYGLVLASLAFAGARTLQRQKR